MSKKYRGTTDRRCRLIFYYLESHFIMVDGISFSEFWKLLEFVEILQQFFLFGGLKLGIHSKFQKFREILKIPKKIPSTMME